MPTIEACNLDLIVPNEAAERSKRRRNWLPPPKNFLIGLAYPKQRYGSLPIIAANLNIFHSCNKKNHSVENLDTADNQQKTPPDGEKGGEKQYKDYEKNPTLFFLNALASKTDAKISIIFIHGTLLDIFLEIFPSF